MQWEACQKHHGPKEVWQFNSICHQVCVDVLQDIQLWMWVFGAIYVEIKGRLKQVIDLCG